MTGRRGNRSSGASPHGTGNRRSAALEVLVVLAAGGILGFLGPFSTYELPPAARYGYWIGLTLLTYALIRPLLWFGRRLARWAGLPNWTGELPMSSVAALLMTLLIAVLLTDMPAAAALQRPDLPLIFLQVWAVGLLIYLGVRQSLRSRSTDHPSHAGTKAVESIAAVPRTVEGTFLEGMPIRTMDDLLCLRMEDHYVRAYHAGGSQLVLIRLRDAVKQLGGIDGTLVNRSWWVPKAAIKRIFGTRRNRKIELVNGLIVPVARSKTAHLDSLGWL